MPSGEGQPFTRECSDVTDFPEPINNVKKLPDEISRRIADAWFTLVTWPPRPEPEEDETEDEE